MTDGEQETARVVADVPADVKQTAKEKLPFGGLSEEIQDTLERIAYGEELGQRSRLERRREELQADLRDARERRREVDAGIATLEDKIDGVDEKLSSLTSREDKYEAKIEELEAMLRQDGTRLDPAHAAVKRAAETGCVEPQGVVETLKERNPDVPTYAFEDGLHDRNTWAGLEPDTATLPVGKREGVEE